MTGMPKKPLNSSKGAVVALLEALLERAIEGEITYVCVVHDVAGTDKVEAKWRGTDTAQKQIDACKGLDALRKTILDKAAKS